MTIAYPLTHPTSPGFSRASFMPRSVVGMSQSPFTLQQQVYDWNAAIWVVQLDLPQMRRAQAEDWVGFLLSLRGRKGTFYLGDPDAKIPRGIATGTAVVSGTNAARATSLVTTGWTPSQTGILKRGDYLSLGTGTTKRLYKNLTDTNSGTGGAATFDIYPPLRETLTGGDAITVGTATGAFRLTDNTTQWDTNEMSVYGLSFTAIEAL